MTNFDKSVDLFPVHLQLNYIMTRASSVLLKSSFFMLLFITIIFNISHSIAQPDIGTSQDPLVTSNPPLEPTEREFLGLVDIRNQVTGGTCSGALLNNLWVLTAAHCVDNASAAFGTFAPLVQPAQLTVTANWSTTQTRTGDRIWWYAPGRDIALIQVATPFRHFGSERSFGNQISRTRPYVGQTLRVFGRGWNIFASPGVSASSDGLYRWRDIDISSISGDVFSFPNSTTESNRPGDSGGPYTEGYGGAIVGVHRSGNFQCPASNPSCAREDAVSSSQGDGQGILAVATDIETTIASPDIPKAPDMKVIDEPGRLFITYLNPTVKVGRDTLALDNCLTFGQSCGEPAAIDFCRRQPKSFSGKVSFALKPWPHTAIGRTEQTCFGPNCVAFARIECVRFMDRPVVPQPGDRPTVRDDRPAPVQGSGPQREIPPIVPRPNTRQDSPTLALEDNTDRNGGDYINLAQTDRTPDSCRRACLADARCKAFTYVRSGFQGPLPRCYLKSSVPPPAPNNCCVSGVK